MKQKSEPSQGDWCLQVQADYDKMNINLTETEIRNMSEQDYKTLIKNSVRQTAFDELQLIKESHSKVKNNKYVDLKKTTRIYI